MDKMISIRDRTVNRQVGNLENQGIINCWETYKFCSIKISGNRNQCLQYCLNTFYHDVDHLKKPPFFGQPCIWVNIQYVVQMTVSLILTGC